MPDNIPQQSTSLTGLLGTFIWAIFVGMGFRLGWGLIVFLIEMAAKAVGH
jgi:hypothetical protein